jgi:hypothetical protein
VPGLVPRDTTKPVSADPPFPGVGHARCTVVLPAVAVTTGALGAVGTSGVTDCSDERVSPFAFTAATW